MDNLSMVSKVVPCGNEDVVRVHIEHLSVFISEWSKHVSHSMSEGVRELVNPKHIIFS